MNTSETFSSLGNCLVFSETLESSYLVLNVFKHLLCNFSFILQGDALINVCFYDTNDRSFATIVS